jgi:hypothetical protein
MSAKFFLRDQHGAVMVEVTIMLSITPYETAGMTYDQATEVLYQTAETLTHLCRRRVRAPRPYPIGPPYVFAMNVSVGRSQHESGSASFGITARSGQPDGPSAPYPNRRCCAARALRRQGINVVEHVKGDGMERTKAHVALLAPPSSKKRKIQLATPARVTCR